MQIGSITKVSAGVVVLLLSSGCNQGPPTEPVLGEPFVGPAVLKIRSDFPLQSAVVATVKHGDRLEIVEQRRLFVRVRAPNGAEGWIEPRQLLGADDMAGLKALAQKAAAMP